MPAWVQVTWPRTALTSVSVPDRRITSRTSSTVTACHPCEEHSLTASCPTRTAAGDRSGAVDSRHEAHLVIQLCNLGAQLRQPLHVRVRQTDIPPLLLALRRRQLEQLCSANVGGEEFGPGAGSRSGSVSARGFVRSAAGSAQMYGSCIAANQPEELCESRAAHVRPSTT